MVKNVLETGTVQWWLLLPIFCISSLATAALEVVTTTTSLGMLAREIGGDKVEVTTLAPPDRDVHYLQAKPRMILALRNADLLILVGADLEVGWLPAAVSSSTNARIQPGANGYFEAASHTQLIGQGHADRALGDVHPEGNPHFSLDPGRMAEIALALAQRLSQQDQQNADYYQSAAEKLVTRLKSLTSQLQEKTTGSAGAVMMHKSGDYLLQLLQLPALGYIEPLPGIPPTASHISALTKQLADQKGVIIHAPYHQDQAARALADNLGWDRYVLPIEPPKASGYAEYETLLLRWAEALSNASPGEQ